MTQSTATDRVSARGRWQFRIKSGLTLMGTFAMILLVYTQLTKLQRLQDRVIAALEADPQVSIQSSRWQDASLSGESHLVSITLRGRVGAEHLEWLGRLPHLQVLDLSTIQLDGAALSGLDQGFPSLEELDLSYCDLRDVDLAKLDKLPRLAELHLSGCNVDAAKVVAFAQRRPAVALIDD